jgi:hypothetical protein
MDGSNNLVGYAEVNNESDEECEASKIFCTCIHVWLCLYAFDFLTLQLGSFDVQFVS